MGKSGESETVEVICPNCMAANAASAHMCRTCMTPLDSFANTDPMLSIYARADTFGKAASGSRSPIVLIGMWITMGPLAFFSGLWIIFALQEVFGQGKFISLLALPILGALEFIAVGLLWKSMKNWRKPVAPEEPEDAEGAEAAEAGEAEQEGEAGPEAAAPADEGDAL